MTVEKTHDTHYIDGEWVAAASAERLAVHDSNTGAVIGAVPAGTAAEAGRAVQAAHAAFDGWAALQPAVRAAYLDRIAIGLEARAGELARLISREVGMPLPQSRGAQMAGPIGHWKHYAELARTFTWERREGNALVVREPVGVVGAITPWNYPLSQATLKVAPALAAGATVVLKPSEVAPLDAVVLAEVIEAAGLPPGVFNLVHGRGAEVGEVLASHPLVDAVSFTGSTRAGRRVAELASQTVKRVALELGGKSASLVLPDADLPAAIKGSLAAGLFNSGQTCSAHTRLLLPEERYDEARELIRAELAKYAVGPSLDEGSRLGPLASAVQRDRVLGWLARGLEEGAEVIAGDARQQQTGEGGYFVQPVVLRVQPGDTLAREEIFGPVLVVITYRGEEEGVRLANDSIYGLGGGVWAGSVEKGQAVARRIRTGQVHVNGGAFNPRAPFGGYRQSGNGREAGVYGLGEYLEYKALLLPE
ncbi:aldehyde dehydrogenase family protein [Xylophilus sp.]|uniref:aldehyde dehydrogenase family protein n=1 Tax=Xylophilus sp. TaxID=2653893 RepID=UPI0013BBECA9|nr:aldehyde dehydrogenase family protein [Xylophilus sp.]KAF1048693.1 MAG: 3-succinoylsemialdehyde-pyridine dehydrogenase [Xylophilus sp.]